MSEYRKSEAWQRAIDHPFGIGTAVAPTRALTMELGAELALRFYKEKLDEAITAAWTRYNDNGERHTEGFADGLEAAMRLLERIE